MPTCSFMSSRLTIVQPRPPSLTWVIEDHGDGELTFDYDESKFLISSSWCCTQLRTCPNHYCTAKDHLKSFLVSERRGKVQKCSACVCNWCWQEWATLTWTIWHQLSHRSYRYFVTCNRSDLLHKQTPIAVLRWGGVSLTCAKPWVQEWGVWLRSCYTVSYTDKNREQVQVWSCDRHVTALWG